MSLLRYNSVALQNLSLSIKSGQKVIICGRTGRYVFQAPCAFQEKTKLTFIISGKSTLLLTLLRLLELQSGQIELDGVDITKVSADVLRERCFITVSQDPLLLSNETLRFNLDPTGTLSNETLIASLQKTELWSRFQQGATGMDEYFGVDSRSSSAFHHILDTKLSDLPELSVGQTQLLALCRALVKAHSAQCIGRKPVVLLDEVTASLDPATESIVHRLIDEAFTEKGHTVLWVAHRIDVLTKYTPPGRDVVVVVLGDGRLQEVITDGSLERLEELGRLD